LQEQTAVAKQRILTAATDGGCLRRNGGSLTAQGRQATNGTVAPFESAVRRRCQHPPFARAFSRLFRL